MDKRARQRGRHRNPRRSTPAGGHRPVLLHEVLTTLQPGGGQFVVDCTLGFAGHAGELLKRVGPAGLLWGFDLDATHLPQAELLLAAIGHPFRVFHGNFAGVSAMVAERASHNVDILLADLGMSSMQVDDSARGFSYVREGPLDMRMDPSRGQTAADLIANITEAELAKTLTEIGDEPAAPAIARAIIHERQRRPIETTAELNEIVFRAVGAPSSRSARWSPWRGKAQWEIHPAARTFQTLRILVNRELANLQSLLRTLPTILKAGGRAAIISFHSGEDRLVKTAFKAGLAAGAYAAIADEPIRAGFQEKQLNPRSRSAKLRWAVRA